MEHHLGTPDPQWEYTLLVRAELERHGRFVTDVDPRDAQAVVDLHWAARQAGRLLGIKPRVELSAPRGHADSSVTATVRCVAVDPTERHRAEEGLERLLHSVRAAAKDPGCAAGTVTAPLPRTAQALRH